ncbi:OmpA family protein [Nocardiopsis sp. ARC36]
MSAALLLTSGCVVASGEAPDTDGTQTSAPESESEPSQDPGSSPEIIASSTATSTNLGSDLQVDVYALETVGNGLLRLRLGLTNNSGENFLLYSGLSDQENLHTASQITLLDAVNQTRHLSYEQTSGSCFCASTDGNVATGETLDLWVVYPEPPSDVETMTITTPMTPPIMNVPITQSSETVENSGLEEPEIIPLTMISDNIEDQTGRTENNDEVSIILASDVLFETNSADLSPDSQEILAQVATEIDDASAGVVNIDGYADNTGNDSVNLPLSSERAEAVEGTLQELVSREGVTFEVEGHGSADPIADNETEEGRERNRRVTVTFAK